MANYTMQCRRCGLHTEYDSLTRLCHRCLCKRVEEQEADIAALRAKLEAANALADSTRNLLEVGDGRYAPYVVSAAKHHARKSVDVFTSLADPCCPAPDAGDCTCTTDRGAR